MIMNNNDYLTEIKRGYLKMTFKVYEKLLANDIVPIKPSNDFGNIIIPEHWFKQKPKSKTENIL